MHDTLLTAYLTILFQALGPLAPTTSSLMFKRFGILGARVLNSFLAKMLVRGNVATIQTLAPVTINCSRKAFTIQLETL